MSAAEVLILVGRLNLAAAAAILVVFALRPLARRRLGARLTYALWLLPPIAMLASLTPARQVLVPSPSFPATPMAAPAWADVGASIAAVPAESATVAVDPFLLVLALWVAGAVIALLATVHVQRRFLAEAKRGKLGPAVVGIFSPRIITPNDFTERFDAEEQALVLAHEQVHIRRQDLRLNALATAVQCLFWFNPLIRLANRHMRIDQELACDEAVVSRFPQGRLAYARALVKSQLANRPLPLGCYWPSGTEHPFLERIAMLKSAHTGARRRVIGAALLTALCAASGLAAWAAIPAEKVFTVPEPEPARAIEVAPTASVAPAPQAPAPKAPAEPPRMVAVEDVCLTNACSEGAAVTTAAPVEEVATCAPSPCRVDHIGRARIPSGVAFRSYFDVNAPVMLKGRVAEMMLRDDGIASEFVVINEEDGARWRVFGGTAATMPAAARAEWQGTLGAQLVVRGYQAHDRSCEAGCIMSGQNVTRPDGSRIGQ